MTRSTEFIFLQSQYATGNMREYNNRWIAIWGEEVISVSESIEILEMEIRDFQGRKRSEAIIPLFAFIHFDKYI